jgi:thiol:disulfide interchange protein
VPGFVALGVGVWLSSPAILIAAAILIAHVGMDRAVGYGLKLPSSFQDTHLGRMGRSRA